MGRIWWVLGAFGDFFGGSRRPPSPARVRMAALPPREFAAQVLPGCVVPTARQGLAQLWPLLLLCLGARLLHRLREWGRKGGTECWGAPGGLGELGGSGGSRVLQRLHERGREGFGAWEDMRGSGGIGALWGTAVSGAVLGREELGAISGVWVGPGLGAASGVWRGSGESGG